MFRKKGVATAAAAAAANTSDGSQLQDQVQWLSKRHQRWHDDADGRSMPPSRQKELIEEYLQHLPPLPHGCPRQTCVVNRQHSEARDRRVHLAPSLVMPTLTAVYLAPDASRIVARGRVVDYTGWILTTQEYQRFGYAVHTAVRLPQLFGADEYVLLGDPTRPGAQINCITGTEKKANAQLTVASNQLKWRSAVVEAEAAAEDRVAYVTNSYITVRALKSLRAGDELWVEYGRDYWQHMSLYCPHCLEYGADEADQMLICEVPGCKRAWHQLCLRPCLVDVPDGPFYCDIHTTTMSN